MGRLFIFPGTFWFCHAIFSEKLKFFFDILSLKKLFYLVNIFNILYFVNILIFYNCFKFEILFNPETLLGQYLSGLVLY